MIFFFNLFTVDREHKRFHGLEPCGEYFNFPQLGLRYHSTALLSRNVVFALKISFMAHKSAVQYSYAHCEAVIINHHLHQSVTLFPVVLLLNVVLFLFFVFCYTLYYPFREIRAALPR